MNSFLIVLLILLLSIMLFGTIFIIFNNTTYDKYVETQSSASCSISGGAPSGTDPYAPSVVNKGMCCDGQTKIHFTADNGNPYWRCPNCAKDGDDAYDPTKYNNGKCCNNKPPTNINGKMICQSTPTPVPPPTPPPPSNCPLTVGAKCGHWTLTFYDNFKTTTSNPLKNWYPMNTFDFYSKSCALYKPENVTVSEDGMVITVGPPKYGKNICTNKAKNPYDSDSCVTSGRVISSFSQKYGLFMWEAKVPRGELIWPALWLTYNGSGWPMSGEIDVMEVVQSVQQRNYYTSRVMVPISLPKSASDIPYGVSIPPDDKPDDIVVLTDWDSYHVWALNWYPTPDGNDVMYDFYIDVVMNNGQIQDKNGQVATPVKSYSLANLVNKWRTYKPPGSWPPQYNLPSVKYIMDNVKPLSMVCNIAVGGAWAPHGSNCSNGVCSGCTNVSAQMIIKNVQVWKYS